MFEGVRAQYLEGLADDVSGVVLAAVVGLLTLGGLYGGGKAVSAMGRAVGEGKRQAAA